MTQKSHAMSLFEWALLLTLAFVWGGSFFFAAVAVVEIPPVTVVWVRVTGAAVILFLALRIMGQSMRWEREVWAAFFFMGLVNNAIPFSLIFWAQTELASGVASILNAMTPVFTVIAAHFLTADERITAPRLLGVVLGFVGVFVLIGTPVGGSLLAHLAVLGAAVSYAFASIFGKRFARLGVKPMVTATGQVSASAILLLPVILVLEQPWTLAMPSPATIWSMIGLVTVSTAFAYFLYFRILSTAGATNVALVTLLVPVFAIALGILVLGESLNARQVLGLFIIVAGLIAIDGRALRWVKR
ncbi:DMT family transporter [Amylibacter sp. IMCC11727]|uniref:DMT family transporter n=1 Tax=Amylibacter sp. IMCC11727 TaxID=3039851 RepID=UPI00244DF9B7|nr:DMT family transporter [Amylibacter sp. IMCC11727]WGI21186.1 DMT family transporter [Amylibacter sp. IMCC11727]